MMPKIKENDWILIPAGTPICNNNWPIPKPYRTNDVLKEDTLARIRYIYDNPDYGVNVIGFRSGDITIAETSPFAVHKWPTVTRDISNQITKGSIWETTQDTLVIVGDWMKSKVITIPTGTKFEVTGKSFIGGQEEKMVPIKAIAGGYENIGVRAFASLKLVKEGVTKTYWKLLDKDDKPVTDKRFANLGNVKSSVRYHTGTIEYDYQDPDNSAPYWVTDNDGEYQKTFDDWKAVHYKYDGTIIETVDLGDWFTIHKLSGKK